MSTIIANDSDISGHGDSFIFITDLHDQDRHYSTALAKYICDNSNVNRVIYGGDYINEPTSHAAAVSQLTSRVTNMRLNDRTIFLRGNHDSNPYGTGQVSDSELHTILCGGLDPDIITDNKLYYYEDNDTEKIRYIYLDTGINGAIDAEQISWFTSAINLSSDWTVVIISHIALVDGGYDVRTTNNYYNVVSSLETIINNATPTIAAWICGHNHIDMYNTTKFSFPIIVVTCDAHSFQASQYSSDARAENTINEQAFNVFHINTSTKTVTITRIGGGEVNVINSGDLTDNDKIYTYT